jgi:cell division protein FtsQ
MKRPEGFDPPRPGGPQDPGPERAGRRTPKQRPEKVQRAEKVQRPAPAAPQSQSRPQASAATTPASPGATGGSPSGSTAPPRRPSSLAGAPKRPGGPPPSQQPEPAEGARTRAAKRAPKEKSAAATLKDAQRRLRRAERRRRRFERGEVKRFTRRSRSRRTIVLTAAGLVATLVAVLVVAIYSPLLALKTITVDGASRVDAAEVTAAVDGQLGTPLALLDYGKFTSELAEFPLIRSYVTEMVPPDTLIIHIVERAPVAAVQNGAEFDLVDPAGIVVQSSPARPDGVPLINIGGQDPSSAAFTSVVAVLLSLPAPLLGQVDSITASTQDNVSFVLRGVGQSVVWGSADRSAYKANALAAMVAKQDPNANIEYDVSAPGSVVVTQR